MDTLSQKRSKNVAIVGMILQIVLAMVMLVIWRLTFSLAAMACMLLLAGGVLLWVIAAILSYCRQLERQEDLELSDMAASAPGGSIFERPGAGVRPAAARLAWFSRWAVPLFTLLFAGYNVTIAILTGSHVLSEQGLTTPGLDNVSDLTLGECIGFCAILFFVGLLLSFYAKGLGKHLSYRQLRAGASYLLVCVLGVAGVIASLAFAVNSFFNNNSVDLWAAYAICGVQLVLGIELVLNFLLDIYRPRVPGQEERLSFDSRLLNLIADPGRVGHSIAETINYQFGFEVSKTWFYKLISRAFVPLVVAAVLVVVGMTCVLIVPSGEQAVLLHLGKAQAHPLAPGVYFKWPWPIDRADRFNTSMIREVYLGAGDPRSQEEYEQTMVKGHEVNLWTQEHGLRKEQDFLVAVQVQDPKAPPVNIIKLVAKVQYVISDAYKYGYKYRDPQTMLQCAAYREMIRYLASATLLDALSGGTKRPQAIMTFGQEAAAKELMRRIQAIVTEPTKDNPEGLDIGIEVTNVSFLAVHPPAQASPAYEEVMVAESKQDGQRYDAQAEAYKTLAAVAGDPAAALRLAFAIRCYQELEGMSLAKSDASNELLRSVQESIGRVRTDLENIDQGIRRDQLLGKIPVRRGNSSAEREPLSDQELLKLEYQAYLRLLEKIQADAKYDLRPDLLKYESLANDLFEKAAGEPAAKVADARVYRWEREMRERARAEARQREQLAYDASPNIYMLDRWLDVWDQALPGVPKYVFGVDRNRLRLWVDLGKETSPMEQALPASK